MDSLPTPLDANNRPLIGHGTEIYTQRFAAVDDDPGSAITISDFPDWKGGIIHYEGSSIVGEMIGNAANSAFINWTSDGVSVPFTTVGVAGDTICTALSSTGTVDVSVMLFR